MAPKGGTFFFLLIVACAALAIPPDGMPKNKRDFRDMAKKLMRKCQTKGYPAPEIMQLKTVFNNNDLPMTDINSEQSGTLLPTFLNVLHSVSTDEELTTKMWNFKNLPTMLKLMRNSSVASACYMQAFVAPLCWATLTSRSENNMTSDEYDTLLSAAKPALRNMPFNLPTDVGRRQNLKKMMKVLMEVYDAMSKDQRTRVVRWVKEQITQKYFNCTMRPPSDPRSMLMKRCKPLLEWLNLEALTMMGPYISCLATKDVDTSPKEQLCEFFRSAQFTSAMNMTSKINPSLGMKFLQKFQECFRGKKEFAENVDKLGILACHFSAAPDLTPDISRKLLSELNSCDDFSNPKIKQLKMTLVKSVMSNTNSTEALGKLGISVALLSPKQLSEIPDEPLKELLKNVGSTVQWTRGQQRTLSKKLLCNNRSLHDCWKSGALMRSLPHYLQSVAGGLPSSVLKNIKNILLDKEGLSNMCMQMTKGQLMAMLQGPLGQMVPSEMMRKLSGRLLQRLSLNKLDKANISLDQVVSETWSQPQVGWAARKLFATKEKERVGYFKNVTLEEMNNIPTYLLLHLPPRKVGDLPDSVCPVLLEKIEEANLSSLPHRSPSRPALTKRALLCLAEGPDLSGLTNETVSKLGPLLCELQPFQLLQMAPDVLNFSLQEMASCQHIPQRHRADIIQLVVQTFGDPSNWTAETMETLGPLLLLDDNATSALPYKPWMKDVLYFLKSGMRPSKALGKKIFDLTTTTSNAASTRNDDEEVTVALIEELGIDNVYWNPAQLSQMSDTTFLATLETLGAVSNWGAEQLAVLSKKAIEVLGPVSQMTESEVIQMRCITRGFSNADLEKLPFSLDTLEEIAKCGWKDPQMEAVWKGVTSYSNLRVQQLDAADMVALSQFICGLNSSEFGQLNVAAFKDAVGSMDGVQCSYKFAQQLKNLAVSAFGKPNTWTEAQVSELGNIIAGLDSAELASLDPAVFSFISKFCIQHILHWAALSVTQLKALGPDNAAMVTSEQRASLSDEQLTALESALTGSPDQTRQSGHSGTPSLNIEGISALIKPFLLLFMGFLLL
ncbi:otoancorin [Anarrhichthys ocellatus]|uniref:otoancorin n=1 Tax=Anarrhichthys ocellatus TaxID=433405 RepID=UPI0012EE1E9A|nr:otoancorin [Anarrhichthys ocellatus]